MEGIVCCRYSPGPDSELITVPIIPEALQQDALYQTHDIPGSGHQGHDRTLQKLRLCAYWVGMCSDVTKYCMECTICQQAKLPTPTKAPLMSLPIGRPWEMLAVDVLEVPLSRKGNCYLLVVQDYFRKWAETFPMPDQTAKRITDILVTLCAICARMGLPRIIHSDQGSNFESIILQQTLQAFGITKSHTTAYHPQGDGMVERLNRSILQLLRAYVTTGKNIFRWSCTLTAPQCIPQLKYHHSSLCLVDIPSLTVSLAVMCLILHHIKRSYKQS